MNSFKKLPPQGRRLILLCAFLSFVSAALLFARSLAPPPPREAFLGVWQGYSESHLEFARLELDQNGTGFLAISYLPQSPPVAYRVTKWTQRGFALDIAVQPVDAKAEPVTLHDVGYGIESISLELRGKDWDREMSLFNEAKFQKRAADASERLKKLRRASSR
jgi:hypothetical protein